MGLTHHCLLSLDFPRNNSRQTISTMSGTQHEDDANGDSEHTVTVVSTISVWAENQETWNPLLLQILIFLVKLLPLSGHSLRRITWPKSSISSCGINIFYKSSMQLQFTNICSTFNLITCFPLPLSNGKQAGWLKGSLSAIRCQNTFRSNTPLFSVVIWLQLSEWIDSNTP